MPTYRVLDVRKPFGRYVPGTLIELDVAAARGFADKLELVAERANDILADLNPSAGSDLGETSSLKSRRGRKRKE